MWRRLLKYSLFGLCIGWSCAGWAQNRIDSLQAELNQSSQDEEARIILMTLLTKEYGETRPDSALSIGRRAKALTELLSKDSLSAQVHISLSTAHSYLAQYDSSTYFSFLALETAEKYADTISMIDAYNNLGIDFMFQEEDQKAIDYYTKVETLSQLFGDSLRWGHALNNLGMMSGYALDVVKELDYYDKAAVIFLQVGEKEGYANTLLNSGTAYTVIEQFSEAEQYYQQALEAFREINYSSGIQNTLQSLAENQLKRGKVTEAESLANEALAIAMEYDFGQDVIYTYELLSSIATHTEDFEKALEYNRMREAKEDEIFTAEKARQISEIETKYESEKKEQQLELNELEIQKNARDQLALLVILFLVVLGGGFVIFFMRRSSKLQQRLLTEEVDNLRFRISTLLGEEQVELNEEGINQALNSPLSEREFEILNLTVSDKSNQEIADKIYVSVNTVKFHLKNIYEKLEVKNRKEAKKFAFGRS